MPRRRTNKGRANFLKSPKNLSARKFFAELFSKKRHKPSTQTNIYPHIAFSFGTKGAKEKALQKENAVFMGRCPKPHSLFEKSETKNF